MRCPSCNYINPDKATSCVQCYTILVAHNVSALAQMPFAPQVGQAAELSLDDLLQNVRVSGTQVAPAKPAETLHGPSPAPISAAKQDIPANTSNIRVDSLLQTKLLDNILNLNQPKVEQLKLEDRSVIEYHNRHGRINELADPPTAKLGAHDGFFYMLDESGEETAYALPVVSRRLVAWAIDNFLMLTLSLIGYMFLKITLLGNAAESGFSIIQKYIIGQLVPGEAPSSTIANREQLERTFAEFNTPNAPALAIMLIFVIAPFLYSFLSLGISGRTFGYFLLEIRSIKFSTGKHPGVVGALLRTLYFSVPQLISVLALFFYPNFLTIVGVLALNLLMYFGQAITIFNRNKRGLHDIVADTCVVNYKPEPRLPNHIYDKIFN